MIHAINLSDKCKSCPFRTYFGLYQCLTEPINDLGEKCTVPLDILGSVEIRRNNESYKVRKERKRNVDHDTEQTKDN